MNHVESDSRVNPSLSLFVQNERYQDPIIIEHLVRANRRGVKILVLARPLDKLQKAKLVESVGGLRTLNDVGIKIHRLRHLKLHAKLVFADNQHAIIGSINLAPGSFDSRRELAIEDHDDLIAKRLHHVVHHDWDNSRPLDLSDEGLLAELEESDPNAAGGSGARHGDEEQLKMRVTPYPPALRRSLPAKRRCQQGCLNVTTHSCLAWASSERLATSSIVGGLGNWSPYKSPYSDPFDNFQTLINY